MGVPALRGGASPRRLGTPGGHGEALPGIAGARALTIARINGTELAYDAAGDGPALVLIHAGVGDRRLWDGVVDAFAEKYRVVRPDLRGFGESPLPGGRFSHVEDVRALLDELGIEDAAVVGNSFGGRVALDLALAAPRRVRALVLLSPALTGDEGSTELDAFDEEEDALLDAGRLDEAVELNLRTWLDGYGRVAAPVSLEERGRVAAMQHQCFVTIVAAYERTPTPDSGGWADPPAAARLAEVSAPTLVVSAVHDHPDFRRIAERIGGGIPGAETAEMETGHLPGIERPDELAGLVLDFLARRA